MINESSTLRPGKFFLDSVIDEPVDGFTEDELWNGWACPYFTREQADIVMAKSNAFNETQDEDIKMMVSWDEVHQAYIVIDHQWINEDGGYPEEVVHGVTIDGVTYYCIGSWSWTWDEARSPASTTNA